MLFERQDIAVDCRVGELPAGVPEEISLTLYRITQEALNNVAKHSGAKSAVISLDSMGGEMILSIRDNGDGFDLAEVRK